MGLMIQMNLHFCKWDSRRLPSSPVDDTLLCRVLQPGSQGGWRSGKERDQFSSPDFPAFGLGMYYVSVRTVSFRGADCNAVAVGRSCCRLRDWRMNCTRREPALSSWRAGEVFLTRDQVMKGATRHHWQ